MANTPTPTIKVQHSTAAVQLRSRSKPSAFFCKLFTIVLVLLTIPLFPSQAPQFCSISSIFTKLWEPLQLLLIGLAICYGLFCKRSTTKLDLDNFSGNGKNDASDLDFSGILDVSLFFEDGFQNSCGYDEKRLILKSLERYKLDEGKGVRSLNFENGSRKKDDMIGEKITKGWNSKYFPGQSMVGVANGDCVVDDWGEPLSEREYEPLNLPVRSLRSNIIVSDKYEENETTEAKFSSDTPHKIRGVRPINLEKKFEAVSLPAPVSGQTRSCMLEMKEEMRELRKSSHLRPHSAGDFDFERLKPMSSQYPLSCHTSFISSSLGELSPSCVKMEDIDTDIDLKSSHMKVSVPTIASEASFMSSKSLHSSFGSSLEITLQRRSKLKFKETNRIPKDNNFNGDNQGDSFVNLDEISTKISSVLSRGKSVRTIRSCKIVPYEMRGSNTEYSETQDSSFLNLEDDENPKVPKKLTIEDNFPVPVMELPETQSEDKEDCFETSSITSKDNSESESDSYSSSSDEEVARSDIEGSEVDRKAGEFIAKFREQIRLQKLASAKRGSHVKLL